MWDQGTESRLRTVVIFLLDSGARDSDFASGELRAVRNEGERNRNRALHYPKEK